jgi:hypothetical protein
MNRNIARAGLAVALAGVFALPSAAQASGNDDVIHRGSCTGTADWKLKASPDDNRIELEFEVDSNRVGQAWNVRIFHDGQRILHGTRTTAGASGSFTVRKLAADHAGRDRFRATATRVGGTQTCTGRVAL